MLKDRNSTKEMTEANSIAFNNFHDIFKEFIENEMDDIISNKTLRNIPVFNLVESVIQTGSALWRTNLLKQTAAFISEFNTRLTKSLLKNIERVLRMIRIKKKSSRELC